MIKKAKTAPTIKVATGARLPITDAVELARSAPAFAGSVKFIFV